MAKLITCLLFYYEINSLHREKCLLLETCVVQPRFCWLRNLGVSPYKADPLSINWLLPVGLLRHPLHPTGVEIARLFQVPTITSQVCLVGKNYLTMCLLDGELKIDII